MNTGKKKVSAKLIVAIVAPVVVFSLLLLAVGTRCIKKRAKKFYSVPHGYGNNFYFVFNFMNSSMFYHKTGTPFSTCTKTLRPHVIFVMKKK